MKQKWLTVSTFSGNKSDKKSATKVGESSQY